MFILLSDKLYYDNIRTIGGGRGDYNGKNNKTTH